MYELRLELAKAQEANINLEKLLYQHKEQFDEQTMLKDILEDDIDQHKDALKEKLTALTVALQAVDERDGTILFLYSKLAEAKLKAREQSNR